MVDYKRYNNIDEVPKDNYPNHICKYRKWENLEKRIITDREIFMSEPQSLTDDYVECSLKWDFSDIDEGELREFTRQIVKRKYPNTNQAQVVLKIDEMMKELTIYDERRRSLVKKHFYDFMNKVTGVFCSCKKNDNICMWNKFANKFSGFCVEFNTYELVKHGEIFGMMGHVNYYSPNNTPTVKPPRLSDEQRVRDSIKEVFNIPDKVGYEDEYRIVKANLRPDATPIVYTINTRKRKLPEDAYSKIYIGDQMCDSDKEELITIANQELPNIPIFEASLNENENCIDFTEL